MNTDPSAQTPTTTLIFYGVVIAIVYLTIISPLLERLTKKSKQIPGPYFIEWLFRFLLSKIPTTGETLVHATSEDLVLKYFDKYGGIFQVNFFGRKLIFVADDKIAQSVLRAGPYEKVSDESGVIREMAGESLLLLSGANWKRQRAALAPAFSHSKAEQFNYAITKQTSAFVSYLRGKSQNGVTSDVPIHIEMTRLAFDVIIRCGLGLETSSGEHAEHFHLILEEMQNPFRRYVPYWRVLPTRTNTKLTKAMISLKNLILHAIDSNPPESSLLGMMLQMNELSHNEVVDNMMSFLLAGHETSASFLSFAIYLLGSNPEVQNAIRSELRTVKSSTGMPASDTLDCIIKEALRLYPPAPMIGRVAESDNTVLDRYDVPQGSIVLISLYAMQRSTSIWGNDAHNCNPDRFRNPTPPMLGAYAPFSSGSRTCIGNHFAINEGRIVLAALLSHFDIELAPTSQFQVRQLATLRPTPELLLNFRVKM